MDSITEQRFYKFRSQLPTHSLHLDLKANEDYAYVAISSAAVPKSFYVLPKDSTISLQENQTNTTITVTKGNYNVTSLVTILNQLFTAADWTYVVSYPSDHKQNQTGKLTFKVSDNAGIQPVITISDLLKPLLGFDNDTQTFSADTLISEIMLDYQQHKQLYLLSDAVRNEDGLLQEIFSANELYQSSINFRNPNLELYSKKKKLGMTHIGISLVDFNNNQIDLNGLFWEVVVCCFNVNKTNILIERYINYKVALDTSIAQSLTDTNDLTKITANNQTAS